MVSHFWGLGDISLIPYQDSRIDNTVKKRRNSDLALITVCTLDSAPTYSQCPEGSCCSVLVNYYTLYKVV